MSNGTRPDGSEFVRIEIPGALIAGDMVCKVNPGSDLWEVTIDFGAGIVRTAKHTYQRGAIMRCVLDFLGFDSFIALRPECRESE